MANAGFTFTCQLINVADLNGVGESEPTPYFYQVYSHIFHIVSHWAQSMDSDNIYIYCTVGMYSITAIGHASYIVYTMIFQNWGLLQKKNQLLAGTLTEYIPVDWTNVSYIHCIHVHQGRQIISKYL